jgi:esterase/lipase
MNINDIITLITNVGFPIVCVLGMGYFIWQLYKQSIEREVKLTQQIDESRAINAKAIDTIAHYAEKLETIQQDVKDIKKDVLVIMSKAD